MPANQTRPAPLHTDSMAYAGRINDGKIPAGWSEAVSEEVAQANIVAALAWERIRDRRDPPFTACSFAHREMLIAETEAILKVGCPTEDARTLLTDAIIQVITEMQEWLNRKQLEGEHDKEL